MLHKHIDKEKDMALLQIQGQQLILKTTAEAEHNKN